MEQVACNLCGCAAFTIVRQGKSDKLSAMYRATEHAPRTYYTIVRCGNCGLVYCSPRPSPDELAEYYRHSDDPAYAGERDGRVRSAIAQVCDLKRFVSSGRLLELGSAYGFFLQAARAASFEVTGIEPSEPARAYAADNFGLSLLAHPIAAQRFADEYFDAVCLFDLLEHLADPKETLLEIARVTRAGAIVILSTPDAESWLAQLLGGYWWGLQEAHVFYFSRQTINHILSATGFDMLEVRPFSREFTVAYWRSKLKTYSSLLYKLLAPIAWGPVGRFKLRMSFPDQMLVVARRR